MSVRGTPGSRQLADSKREAAGMGQKGSEWMDKAAAEGAPKNWTPNPDTD